VSVNEDTGLLWKLVSEVAALNGQAAVDAGIQTDAARYQAIIPLGTAVTCLLFLFGLKGKYIVWCQQAEQATKLSYCVCHMQQNVCSLLLFMMIRHVQFLIGFEIVLF